MPKGILLKWSCFKILFSNDSKNWRVKNVKFVIRRSKIWIPSPNVIYTGFVQDLASYINLGDVCVAPYPPSAVCGGTRNKVADYFACGKPVVSTEEGMREFNDAVSDRDFLPASDSDDFVEKLLRTF